MAGLSLVVEFLNTVDARTFRRHGADHLTTDTLTSARALSEWLSAHDLAAASNRQTATDLAAAVALRSALRAALLGDGDAARALADHPVQLVPDPAGGLRLAARSGRRWSDTLVETVALHAARGDWGRVRLCAAPDCRWAFLDTSRSGQGRWCEMGACGNRHKTKAYRERRARGDRLDPTGDGVS